jgi:hypothetical protein
MAYPSPCDNCPHDGKNSCKYKHCQPWLTRYRYKQKQINAYAKKVLPAYYASIGKDGDGGGGK